MILLLCGGYGISKAVGNEDKDCQGSEVGQVIGTDKIHGYYCNKEAIVHNNVLVDIWHYGFGKI